MAAETAPGGRHCLLLGAGHAQVEVLRAFARQPLRDVTVTLIAPAMRAPYTGMAPGYVAGRYQFDDASIDVETLARAAGATIKVTKAIEIDRNAQQVLCADGSRAPYDVLSINVGAVTRAPFSIERSGPVMLPVKPAEPFIETLSAFLARETNPSIAVVGGGLGGIELAAALATRRPPSDGGANDRPVHLIAGAAGLAPHAPMGARDLARQKLGRKGVVVLEGVNATGADDSGVHLADGRRVPADLVILSTGVAPSSLMSGLDLPKDEDGYLTVNATLQSAGDPRIFAAGDCAGMPAPNTAGALPKAGVYAVRAGPVLAQNIRAALTGGALKTFIPQREFLTIMTFNPLGAVAVKGGFSLAGQWVDAWKTWIDKRFIARYNSL